MELNIDPTAPKDTHCKVYTEKSIADAIKKFQIQQGLNSFSEAGRKLWIMALELV